MPLDPRSAAAFEYGALRPPAELEKYILEVFNISRSPADALADDDWSFVIKMSAYIEVVLAELLMAHFNDPKLQTVFGKMNMGSDRQGKLAFAKALKLLPDNAWHFIKLLSDLRGEIVHRVSKLNLDLSEYIRTCERKEQWKQALASWAEPGDSPLFTDPAAIPPRWLIFGAVMKIMAQTAVQTDRVKLDHRIAEWLRDLGQRERERLTQERQRTSSPNQPTEHHQSAGPSDAP